MPYPYPHSHLHPHSQVHRLLITEAPLDLSKHRFGRHVHSALHKRAVALNINL